MARNPDKYTSYSLITFSVIGHSNGTNFLCIHHIDWVAPDQLLSIKHNLIIDDNL